MPVCAVMIASSAFPHGGGTAGRCVCREPAVTQLALQVIVPWPVMRSGNRVVQKPEQPTYPGTPLRFRLRTAAMRARPEAVVVRGPLQTPEEPISG